jgi:Ca2+-binding RTX toxin-like protein
MSGTDVTRVNIELASMIGGSAGDGQADTVRILGTNGADAINVHSSAAEIVVSGLAAETHIQNAEGANDKLVIVGSGGDDVIDAGGLATGRISLEIEGGLGEDVITGSKGNDAVNGGDGDDVARLGAGDDVFTWNPGDDNDTIEGQAGSDTLDFNGANVSESVTIFANGGRAQFFRDVANVTMDMDGVETISFDAFGGADTVTVNDMSGTDVSHVAINLAGSPGGSGGDGQVDTIVLNATNGDDTITFANNNGVITVTGLGSEVTITNFDANDRIVINGLAGNDVVDASGLSGMVLTADGGDGDDVLVGSAGADTLLGGAGDDVLIGGGGIDTLDGGPGDNVVLQNLIVQQPGLMI